MVTSITKKKGFVEIVVKSLKTVRNAFSKIAFSVKIIISC